MSRSALILVAALVVPLAGCELLGGDSAEAVTARREAEGKAVGGACRHAGRAIEDCFVLNKRADKAAIFAGWREMNDYMRDNKVETVPPQNGPAPAESAARAEPQAAGDDSSSRPAPKAKKADKAES